MPTYRYRRLTDGSEFELVQKITEPALTVCPETGSPVERVIQAAGFVLKGSGWYKTDYGSNGSSGGRNGSSNGRSASKSSEQSSAESSSSSGSAESAGGCCPCGKTEGGCGSGSSDA